MLVVVEYVVLTRCRRPDAFRRLCSGGERNSFLRIGDSAVNVTCREVVGGVVGRGGVCSVLVELEL